MDRDLKRQKLAWMATEDSEYPYEAYFELKKYIIRVNDFPAEAFYSLISDGKVLDEFDDWPSDWLRPE
ncbi:hypothetical protein [Microbulbifer variabilis]|uniref:hypothetical protein n=1 Tax=Microbulbifer variabilis TaxID=266805 RepID=UPI001CFE4B04|nr:hypothetical protein [Microbulbifer variabilis]